MPIMAHAFPTDMKGVSHTELNSYGGLSMKPARLYFALLAFSLAWTAACTAGSDAGAGGPDSPSSSGSAASDTAASTPVENPPGNRYFDDQGDLRVALVKMPYSGARNVPELSGGPDYLENGGLLDILDGMDVQLRDTETVGLLPYEENDYGEWHRMGMASGHYGELVADNERNGYLTVGWLANCTSLLGSLAGLQQSGSGDAPRKVAMVFIDAHGDFNTPESTLSGMLGGMPLAVSAGMCLTNLRTEAGLDPPLPTSFILLGAARDLDPLDRELVEESDIVQFSTEDIREISDQLRAQMQRLSEIADLIYIHIDMDVLDPAEVPGHPLTVPGGPTSLELGTALEAMFEYPKAAALGIASTPWGPRDPDGLSLRAAYNLIEGALRGVQARALVRPGQGKHMTQLFVDVVLVADRVGNLGTQDVAEALAHAVDRRLDGPLAEIQRLGDLLVGSIRAVTDNEWGQ